MSLGIACGPAAAAVDAVTAAGDTTVAGRVVGGAAAAGFAGDFGPAGFAGDFGPAGTVDGERHIPSTHFLGLLHFFFSSHS